MKIGVYEAHSLTAFSSRTPDLNLSHSSTMADTKEEFYSSLIVNAVLNVASSFAAVTLNLLTIHAMRKTSSLPETLKTLLLSLTVSDLGVGLLVQPFYVEELLALLLQNDLASSVRKSMDFIVRLILYASLFSVTAVGVDRFLAVHLHLRYQELVTHKRTVAGVLLIWVFSALLSVMRIIWVHMGIVVGFILGFCFVSLTVANCRIYFVVVRLTNQIRPLQVQQVSQDDEKLVNDVKQRKTAVNTSYVLILFLFCYLPHYCSFVASVFIRGSNVTLELFLMYTCSLLHLNSSLNPVIYCWKMRQVRKGIAEILRNMLFR